MNPPVAPVPGTQPRSGHAENRPRRSRSRKGQSHNPLFRRDSGGHTTPLVGVLAVSLGPNKDDPRVTTIDNQETFLVCKRIIYPTEEMRLELDGAIMLVLCDGLGVGGSQLSSSTH